MNIFSFLITGYKLFTEVSRMKSGVFTSEFWITIVNVVGLILGAFLDKIPPETALIVGAVLTGLYIIARTIVKATPTLDDDALVEKIKEAIIDKFPNPQA